MTNPIIVINVSQTTPPAPSKLQRTGAFVSQGGTNRADQSLTLVTELADLTSILSAAKTLTSLTWLSSVVTGTTTTAHGWDIGDTFKVIIAGVTPAGYNGTYVATVTGASTFTYPLVANPGSETVPGTVTVYAESELLQMGTTFFAQGRANSVYVLELGEGPPADGVAALTTFLTANPNQEYSFLVPREWDGVSEYLTFLALYESPTAMAYFWTTTTAGTYTAYTSAMKCVVAMVEAPSLPATEFSLASAFYVTLNYNPTSTNKVPPLAFSYLFGVTAYPLTGNGALLTALRAASINVVGTGAEGGLSNTILFYGHTKDSNPFNYWYSADWAQINIQLELANEIINGSNNPLAPLYYDQPGINRLQNRAAKTISTAVSYGLATGKVVTTQLSAAQFRQNFDAGLYAGQLVINAEPFRAYTAANPNDFAIGRYGGLAAIYTPSRGFEQIIFDLNVTNFVA